MNCKCINWAFACNGNHLITSIYCMLLAPCLQSLTSKTAYICHVSCSCMHLERYIYNIFRPTNYKENFMKDSNHIFEDSSMMETKLHFFFSQIRRRMTITQFQTHSPSPNTSQLLYRPPPQILLLLLPRVVSSRLPLPFLQQPMQQLPPTLRLQRPKR